VAAELDALRMKLQPHFLFNTLNAIGSLARVGETDAIVRVVEHLGRLLRLSMETSGSQFIALEEELALLDEYLSIEEIRFRDGLRVVRRIDPATRSALVPNLILQPLVENAIVHGLSRRIGSSLVEIVAGVENGTLRLAVRDDGPGLPAGWTLAAGAGRGLKNVEDRLRALYPGTHRFTMANGEAGGAVAQVCLPLVDAGAGGGES
jgi:two-component system, LytTR family, sensor kinase